MFAQDAGDSDLEDGDQHPDPDDDIDAPMRQCNSIFAKVSAVFVFESLLCFMYAFAFVCV